jgi:hypothetical protein
MLSYFRKVLVLVTLVTGVTLVIGGCAAGPRGRPVKGADVDTGIGSMEATRRQLQGSWALVSYEVFDGGKLRKLDATGTMTYDEFSNMRLVGQLKGESERANAKPAALNFSGRVALDVVKHTFHPVVEQKADELPANVADQMDTDNTRTYEINGNALTLTVLGADGKPTAISRWRKTG